MIMKYVVRAVKYFLTMALLVVVILALLNYYQFHNWNLLLSLRGGARSLLWIALMLGGFSAVYPSFGYACRPLDVRGEPDEILPVIRAYMEDKGYRIEKEGPEVVTFRIRSPFTRLMRTFEDRITFTRTHAGYTIEGLNREIVRLKSAIEYKYQNRDIL